MRQLALALDQEYLGEDRDGDLARRLVAELQPDGRVQPLVGARIAAGSARDVAQDDRDFPLAADQADVARPRAEGRFEHAFVERVAASEHDDEIRGTGNEATQRLRAEVLAPDFGGFRTAIAAREVLAVVDDDGGETDLAGDRGDPLADVTGAVQHQSRSRLDDV